MDTGACDFDMDIDTTKEIAKAGDRVHDWHPEVVKLVSKEDWSADGRLCMWVDSGASRATSDEHKPGWADVMTRYVELAKLVAASLEMCFMCPR